MLTTRGIGQIGLEQLGLRREVPLLRAVQIEVIAAEVGEHGDVEVAAGDALQLERVRRHLDHDVGDAVFHELGQPGLQIG